MTVTQARTPIDMNFVVGFGMLRWETFAASRIGGNEYARKMGQCCCVIDSKVKTGCEMPVLGFIR